jgi:hypothetical protein
MAPRRLAREHGRRRLIGQITLVRQACHGRRQRFADRQIGLDGGAFLDLVQQAQDARPALRRVVEPNVELGDPLQPQSVTELAAHERHRPAEGFHRGVAFLWLADDADPDQGMPKIGRGLDVGDRGEADPRIRHLSRDDLGDFLAKQLVQLFRALAHLELPCDVQGRSGEGASEKVSECTAVCMSEPSQLATHPWAVMQVAASVSR